MTPDQVQMRCCLDLSINIRNMGEGTVVGIPVKGGGFMQAQSSTVSDIFILVQEKTVSMIVSCR